MFHTAQDAPTTYKHHGRSLKPALKTAPLTLILWVVLLSATLMQTQEASAHAWAKQKPVLFLSAEVGKSDLKLTICLPKPLLDEVVSQVIDPNYTLTPTQQQGLFTELERYFQNHNPIKIDGIRALPNLIALDLVLSAPLQEVEAAPLAERVKLHSGNEAAAIMTFELGLKQQPQLISLLWNSDPLWVKMGSRRPGSLTSKVMPGVMVYQDELTPIKLTPEDPEHLWRPLGPKLKTPSPSALSISPPPLPTFQDYPWTLALSIIGLLASALLFNRARSSVLRAAVTLVALSSSLLLCLYFAEAQSPFASEGARLSNDQTREIFEVLHQNIYRAFDYERDEEVYDALAQSVSGELLDWTFQEIYRSLILQDEGGAQAKVSLVKPLEWERAELNDRERAALKSESGDPAQKLTQQASAFAVRYRWRVIGEVTHWGHSHRRVNDYKARYAVAHTSRGWRIFSVRTQARARRPELEGGL